MAEARIARRFGWNVAIGGGTTAGAAQAAQHLVNQGAQALISFGLAGGLDPALRPGTLILPSVVVSGGTRYPTNADLTQRLGGTTGNVLLGAEQVVASATQKHRLHNASSAVAVDLESGAVARVAAARGVPFAVLRAICDPAERELPFAALAALDARGAIGLWRVLGALVRHPSQLPALIALATDATAARRALLARITQLALESTHPPSA